MEMKFGPNAKVATVTLNWNGLSDTIGCVASVLQQTHNNIQIYVVDNASDHQEVDELRRKFSAEQRVTILASEENLGYAGGNNLGIQRALADGCDFIWLLNNDAVALPDALSQAIAHSQGLTVGITGFTVLYPDKQTIYALGGGLINFWFGTDRLIGARQRLGQVPPPTHLDYISGASLLIDRRVLDTIGYFDERFFLYSEEADLCQRAHQAGFELAYAPKAIVMHASAKSTGHFSKTYVYYLLRNKILLQKKHGRWWQWITFWPVYLVYMCGGMYVISLVKTAHSHLGTILTAIRDGIMGRYGRRQLE